VSGKFGGKVDLAGVSEGARNPKHERPDDVQEGMKHEEVGQEAKSRKAGDEERRAAVGCEA
jgi:hypothetical protein